MRESELRALLERGTDRIDAPGLGSEAVSAARGRRTRQRGAVASVAAAAVVATVLLLSPGADVGKPAPAPTPAPTSVPSPSPSEESARPWDPRKVDELPTADADIAAALPAVVDPPASAPTLSETPLSRAILSVELDGAAMLLGTDGTWRSVPLVGYEHAELSPAGARLVVSTGQEATVWDLAAGASTVLPIPEDHLPWDFQGWGWLDDGTLLFTDGQGGFVVDPSTGATERVPYPDPSSFYWTVDPAGDVVEASGSGQPSELTEWRDDEPRTRGLRRYGHLAGLAVGAETVAGTTYDAGAAGFRVVALERSDLTLRDDLLLGDFEGNYSNGALGSVALLGDDVVLLRVTKIGRAGYEGWRLVAWEIGTDDLALVTRIDGDEIGNVTLATALLD